MKKTLKQLSKEIAEHLGIEEVKFNYDNIPDNSRLNIPGLTITISKEFENNYIETAKCLTHEYRHIFQMYYIKLFNDERSLRWKYEYMNCYNSSNLPNYETYFTQEIEIDSFSFTKFYLKTFENIDIKYEFDDILTKYINRNLNIM